MIHKLQKKFIAIAMLSVTLVLLVMGIGINAAGYAAANSELDAMLEMIADNEGTVPQFQPGDGGKQKGPGAFGQNRFTAETPYSTRYFVLRYSADGTLDNADLRHIAAVSEDDVQPYLSLALQQGEGTGSTGSYKFRVLQTGQDHYMAVFLDTGEKRATLKTYAWVTVLVIAASEGLIFVLVLLLSRRAIGPVIESMEKQKQFITDAGHELKTPLTVIGTSLKVLEMDTGKNKWIDKIEAQTEKLARLVGQLVALSRLDEEKPPLHFVWFELTAAAEEVAASFADHAEACGHALKTEIGQELSLCGDEAAVRQLISILLDNAVKYADAGGEICLTVKSAKKGVQITLENPCANAEKIETDKLFDRFYRADPSRSGKTPGFGIGLSIARSIAEAHKGTMRADCSTPGKIRFTAQLKNSK